MYIFIYSRKIWKRREIYGYVAFLIIFICTIYSCVFWKYWLEETNATALSCCKFYIAERKFHEQKESGISDLIKYGRSSAYLFPLCINIIAVNICDYFPYLRALKKRSDNIWCFHISNRSYKLSLLWFLF